MNRADEYLIETLKELRDTPYRDDNPRPKYKDGTPAYSKYITQKVFKYNIASGEFPIPTLRPTAIKMAIKEMFWIYQKQSNILKDAHDLGITWWDDWDIGDGTIGARYGYTVDKHGLMDKLLIGLGNNPFGRRNMLNLYQESDFEESGGLYPCCFLSKYTVREHKYFNGYVRYIDVTLDSRSSDFITAGFINQIQYVALAMMVCGHLSYITGLDYRVGDFMFVGENVHMYERHEWAIEELLSRTPSSEQPKIELLSNKNFYDYTIDDFKITVPKIEKLSKALELAI